MGVCAPPPQQHRFTYNEAMPVESCTQALSDLALRFGEDDDEEGGMVRGNFSVLAPLLYPPVHLHASLFRVSCCNLAKTEAKGWQRMQAYMQAVLGRCI